MENELQLRLLNTGIDSLMAGYLRDRWQRRTVGGRS